MGIRKNVFKMLSRAVIHSPMFSAKPDFSVVPSTAIISESRVRKREVVYVSDHSTDVYKRQNISRLAGDIKI